MKRIQQSKANVKIRKPELPILREKQKYGHVIVDIEEEEAWANVQVKTEDKGISVEVFNNEGKLVDFTFFFYSEIQNPRSIE